MVKCKWLVLRYWMDDYPALISKSVGPRDATKSSGSVFVFGSFQKGYVGMVFPDTLYPTPNDLPQRRREIDVFRDLRRDNLER